MFLKNNPCAGLFPNISPGFYTAFIRHWALALPFLAYQRKMPKACHRQWDKIQLKCSNLQPFSHAKTGSSN
jgi:hypothetical protein